MAAVANRAWVLALASVLLVPAAVFDNSVAPDKTKQTLYLFRTLDGHYMAANFTGK